MQIKRLRNSLLVDLLLANILDNFIFVLTMIVRRKKMFINIIDFSCSSFWIFFSSGKFDQRNQKTGKCNYEINFSGKSRVAKISRTNTSLSFLTYICLIGHKTTIFFFNFATATVGGSVNWKKFHSSNFCQLLISI